MKKLILGVVALVLTGQMAFAQPVADQAIIPVAVTLNSILRLNIVRGGHIEFVFNTIDQFELGITNSEAYDTEFTVASSVDWDARMYAEDAQFNGTDLTTANGGPNQMDLDNVGYWVEAIGTFQQPADVTIPAVDVANVLPLTNVAATDIVTAVDNAGDIVENDYTIHWFCGTQDGSMNVTPIIDQDLLPDRYVTNVYLIIEPN